MVSQGVYRAKESTHTMLTKPIPKHSKTTLRCFDRMATTGIQYSGKSHRKCSTPGQGNLDSRNVGLLMSSRHIL